MCWIRFSRVFLAWTKTPLATKIAGGYFVRAKTVADLVIVIAMFVFGGDTRSTFLIMQRRRSHFINIYTSLGPKTELGKNGCRPGYCDCYVCILGRNSPPSHHWKYLITGPGGTAGIFMKRRRHLARKLGKNTS